MSNGNGSTGEIHSKSLIRHAVTFLIGSGGAGTAIAMMGEKGLQREAIITLAICLGAAVFLILLLILMEQKSRTRGLQRLNDLYVDALRTVGDFLVRGDPKDARILRSQAEDLRTRAISQRAGKTDVLFQFRTGAEEVAAHWEELAASGVVDDADPLQQDGAGGTG